MMEVHGVLKQVGATTTFKGKAMNRHKYKDGYHKHMEALVSAYEEEDCDFTNQENNKRLLDMYTARMEDSHLKCVLYMFLKVMEE